MSDLLVESYFTAVKKGNIEKAKEAINSLSLLHFNLDSIYELHEFTLLTYAVKFNRSEIVEYLIQKGADINTQDKLYTPLAVACIKKNINMIKKLLELGADPNSLFQQDDNKYMAIHVAITNGNLEVVKTLVEGGTDLNDTSIILPLVQAIKEGNKDIINYLLDNGADVNARPIIALNDDTDEIYEYPPILAAIAKRDEDTLKKLIELGANTNASYEGYSALIMALKWNADMVRLLCENGADVNYKHPVSGNTPLIRAITNIPILLPVIRVLCEFGADKKIKNKRNETAASYALHIEDEDTMNDVLAILKWCGITDPKGVSLTEENDNTENEPGKVEKNVEDVNAQLKSAIQEGNLKLIKQLIAYGADVSFNDYEPLIDAAASRNLEIFKYILSISGLFLDKKTTPNVLLYKFLTATGNNLDIFKYIEKRSGSNFKNVLFDITQYNILKLNNRTVSYILVHYSKEFKLSEIIALMIAAHRSSNRQSFLNLFDLLSFDKLSEKEKASLGDFVKKFANMGDLQMLKVFKLKGFDFKPIGDDLWKLVYRRWVDIEKFLEDSNIPKPDSLTEKVNTNNTPYGGKRRTRKFKSTHRKLSNHSRKH